MEGQRQLGRQRGKDGDDDVDDVDDDGREALYQKQMVTSSSRPTTDFHSV